MIRKTFAFIILGTVVAVGLFLSPPAEAATDTTNAISACTGSIGTSILGFLGGGGLGSVTSRLTGTVPVSDAGAQTQITAGRVQSCVQVLLDQIKQLALATLKRRVLNVMVDETINWINGGGQPQFVTNFNDFINSAGQAAAGDVIRGVGLGQMCQGLRMPIITFLSGGRAAGEPVFSQQITCTLNQVIQNINNFENDFRAGNWIAFNESWRPQNNYYGAILVAGDQLISETLASEQAAQTSAIAGQGFTPTQRCLSWTLWGTKADLSAVQITTMDGSTYSNPNQSSQIPIPSNVSPNDYIDASWVCSQITNTTPASTIAGVTQKALTAHVDNVINAQTFADYAEALVGAAINRVIQVGVSGLVGVATPNAPRQGYVSLSQQGSQPDDLLGGAGTTYTGTVQETQSAGTQINLSTQLSLAQNALNQALNNIISASSTNGQIITLLANFQSWCNSNNGSTSHLVTCSPLPGQIAASNSLTVTLNQKYAQIPTLQDKLTTLITKVNQATSTAITTLSGSVSDIVNQVSDLTSYVSTANDSVTSQIVSLQNSYNACVTPSVGNNVCN